LVSYLLELEALVRKVILALLVPVVKKGKKVTRDLPVLKVLLVKED
jgi:hypothetical protein